MLTWFSQEPGSWGSANRWPQQLWYPQLWCPHPHTQIQSDLQQLCLSASQQTRSHSFRWGLHVVREGSTVFSPPAPPTLLPPSKRTADAFASTGALYRKDHLGIFRFGNLRALACDWLLWPHDNLGRNCSCVLSPSVSLEGSWGVFGCLGRPLSFNITGKERSGETLTM